MQFIKHRPTVLDELPLEVIRTFILPCLDYDSRIQLNQCLPPWDRLSMKMNPLSVRRHSQMVSVSMLSQMVSAIYNLQGKKKYKTMIRMFQYHQKQPYFQVILENPSYCKVVLEKIHSYNVELINPSLSIDLNDRIRLVSELKKLRKKIEVATMSPISYKEVPLLNFV